MKKNNVYKMFGILSIICLLVIFGICYQTPTYAATSTKQSETIITPHRLKEWDNGAKVKKKVTGYGKKYKLSVTADTTGLTEGYYSVYYYDYGKRNINSYDGMQYHFSNTNDFAVKINTTLTVSKKESLTLVDDSYVILTSDDGSINRVEKTLYGTITIPAGYSGNVYIPFSQFRTSEEKEVALKSIMSWGITVVLEQEQKATYEISHVAFLRHSVANKNASYLVYTIEGNTNILVPSVGSVLESYQATAKDMEGNDSTDAIEFFLPDAIAGVTISKDGKLEIQNDCVASEIKIAAKTSYSTNYGVYTITLNRLSATVSKTGVPRVEDVASISSERISFAVKWLFWIRIGVIAILALIACIFISWMMAAKKHYGEIKQEFYKNFQQIDEEKKS